MLIFHQLDKVSIIVIIGRNSFLKAIFLHDRVFAAFPFKKFLFEVKSDIYGFESKGKGRDMGFNFEFVLESLLELLDDHGA